MAYPFSRRRIPRQPKFQQPDMTDGNENGYPDAFEAEESQVLQQIAARRKAFMQRAGQAEGQFIQQAEEQDPTIPSDDGDTESVTKYLFK